jgi:glycosyltransferase involved in cell wall biosynthesis
VARPSILFVSLMNGGEWGGSEEAWYRAALHAASSGHRVACAVYAWPGRRERLDALRAAGVAVIELPNRARAKRSLAERLEYELLTKARQRRAIRRLPFGEFDCVVLSQGGWRDIVAAEWSAVQPRLRRYALVFHNYEERLELAARHRERLARWVSGAAANLFDADRIRAVLEARLGLAVPNAAVLHNPIGFRPPDAPAPLPPGPPWRFAMLAALDLGRKAQDSLVEALSRPAWRERSFEVSLYGSGHDERRLAALVEARGLAGKVVLRGHTRDVRAAIEGAHVVLHLTRVDAMPIAVFEAMAVGRPVAVSPVGDMPAWIVPGDTGWVSTAATGDAFAATLEEVWASRADWARMGARAFERFRARYPSSPEQRIVDQVLGAQRRPGANVR